MKSLDTAERTLSMLMDFSSLEQISRDDSLAEDLGMDSLSMVSLLVLIEEEFGFELRESDMNPTELQTAGDVVSLVQRYTQEVA